MNLHGFVGVAAVLGASAGAVGGAAVVATPVVRSAVQALAFEIPSNVYGPPGGPGTAFDHVEGGLPPVYDTVTEKVPYTLYLDNTPEEIGHYTIARNYEWFGPLPFYQDDHQVVIDNDGAAADPRVGTEWDQSSSGLSFGINRVDFYENFYAHDPTAGITQDLLKIDFLTQAVMGNYYSNGPDGMVDVFNFFGAEIPLINTTGEPLATAAADLAGVGDLGAGDLSALGSDIAALF